MSQIPSGKGQKIRPMHFSTMGAKLRRPLDVSFGGFCFILIDKHTVVVNIGLTIVN